MEGKFDRKWRRAKTTGWNWAKRLVKPATFQALVVLLVWITRVIEALYKLFKVFRD